MSVQKIYETPDGWKFKCPSERHEIPVISEAYPTQKIALEQYHKHINKFHAK